MYFQLQYLRSNLTPMLIWYNIRSAYPVILSIWNCQLDLMEFMNFGPFWMSTFSGSLKHDV